MRKKESQYDPIKIGVSSCLLGNQVRYDGGHQHDRYITGTLGQFFDFVPVCPEVECGLPVPREAMRLVGEPEKPRLLTIRTKIDHTEKMQNWAAERVKQLESDDLHGFIFKSKSPSSGMERVKVYGEGNIPSNKGVGMFARTFMEHFPLLPVEEDGRLHDIPLRENYIERIFVYKRWRDLIDNNKTLGGLVAFHSQHKLLIMAHSVEHYRRLGPLVAHGKEKSEEELFSEYLQILTEALRRKCTIKKHVNVLHHMLGYFKKVLSADEKKEMLEVIEQYGKALIPLIVPITLFNHYVRKYSQEYLAAQMYLHPHPIELKLRNHA